MARIAGINIPQNKLVQVGLTYIYGIGDKFSKQICTSLAIPKEKRVNQLTDDEILDAGLDRLGDDGKMVDQGFPFKPSQLYFYKIPKTTEDEFIDQENKIGSAA